MKFLSSVVVLFAAGALASPMLEKRQDTCSDVNAAYNGCGTACPPSCKNPNPEICTMQCVSECQCKEGYLVNEATGACVTADQCPTE